MHYKLLGKTELRLSEITFGAWAAGGWMWGGTERKDALDAMHAAYDLGVTSIDTAPVYGQGTSENIVGAFIKDKPRDQIQILTKYGMRWDLAKGRFDFSSKTSNGTPIDIYKYAGPESVREEIEDSLRRLGTDYVDLYQIHWPDVTTPIGDTMEVVSHLIEEGKVRYAGVCNYNAAQLEEAEKFIALASDQVPYNMIRRKIEKDVVPYCLEHNKAILAYSPLERGLLTGKMKPGYTFNAGDHRSDVYLFSDENMRRVQVFLNKINPLAEEKNVTLAQLVLRWTLEQPGITVALVGARNARQAIQNAKTTDVRLTDEEVAMINGYVRDLKMEKPGNP
jgi:aryl-alcohol dehydrogenase-like predicted oxidoreductase